MEKSVIVALLFFPVGGRSVRILLFQIRRCRRPKIQSGYAVGKLIKLPTGED